MHLKSSPCVGLPRVFIWWWLLWAGGEEGTWSRMMELGFFSQLWIPEENTLPKVVLLLGKFVENNA